jgi:hypothetical protein
VRFGADSDAFILICLKVICSTFQRPSTSSIRYLWSMPKESRKKGTRKVSRGRLGQCRKSETLCQRSQTVLLGSDSTSIALADASRPTGKPVGDVAAVAVGGNTESQVTARVQGAGVVHAGGLIELLNAVSSGSI